ncbi:unnamed protein product [Fraxinus pennsylvanica]|uniref:Uncharacterized protein n=1 Tax=Fraxinus pennsylvanica TaxID=56036 RepID=A0AAD1ZKN9_9LAMI|nr:unnamed protein product [Fraxinus pennsylvanica]
MAVQRQTAASRSARPWTREQHGVCGGVPTTTFTKPFNKLAHTPNFRVSSGYILFDGGWGLWPWPPLGVAGGGGHGTDVELTIVKKRILKRRRSAFEATTLDAIFFGGGGNSHKCKYENMFWVV